LQPVGCTHFRLTQFGRHRCCAWLTSEYNTCLDVLCKSPSQHCVRAAVQEARGAEKWGLQAASCRPNCGDRHVRPVVRNGFVCRAHDARLCARQKTRRKQPLHCVCNHRLVGIQYEIVPNSGRRQKRRQIRVARGSEGTLPLPRRNARHTPRDDCACLLSSKVCFALLSM
jgi:hypothetical protein